MAASLPLSTALQVYRAASADTCPEHVLLRASPQRQRSAVRERRTPRVVRARGAREQRSRAALPPLASPRSSKAFLLISARAVRARIALCVLLGHAPGRDGRACPRLRLCARSVRSLTGRGCLQHLSVVICGHVDSGKSTTTGRLIFELGGIPEREIEKLKDEASALGKSSFAFAFYMDRQKEERERGVTISCTTKEFFTENWHYTIIDAPGHRDFIKNMISGAAQADVCLLMVPADGNFTTAIQKGDHKANEVQARPSLPPPLRPARPAFTLSSMFSLTTAACFQGQTRQHARLLCLLGVRQLCVGVNKMDCDTAGYKEDRYKEIKDEMKHMLTKVCPLCLSRPHEGVSICSAPPRCSGSATIIVLPGVVVRVVCGSTSWVRVSAWLQVGWKKDFVDNSVPFLPISGWIGDNLIKASEKMTWWKPVEIKSLSGKAVQARACKLISEC